SVRQKGGLAVIGTEMLPERVKLQLAGRAGRQGDPGTSQFYISLEEDFISGASTERFRNYYRHLIAEKNAGKPISRLNNPRVKFSLWMLKSRVASGEENQRIQTNKYEVTLRLQRKAFYDTRNNIIDKKQLERLAGKWISQGIDYYLAQRETWTTLDIRRLVNNHFSYDYQKIPQNLKTKAEIKTYLERLSRQILEEKFKILVNSQQLNQYYRTCILFALDGCWTDQVDYLTLLRTYVSQWGMSGRDPGYVYNVRALRHYKKMLRNAKMATI
ncbi:hypothetical protein, partial [Bartonella sp. TT110JLCBS]|uniref:preprotein translocase subunit SecA n=1 Tax=Bartonella sp. TT110JLCBS TaxID=3243578 RepID=UPI0035D02C28